jgi:LmbE family N-acetylglucosaminyl deacetylase
MATARVNRILVVTAHPDDVDFGAAGTIARWTDCGIEVTYCIVTDGDAGGSDRSVSRADVGMIRRAEQTAAAKEVGVSDLRFLGHPDSRVEPTLDLRRDISRVIRQTRADRVLLPSPERNWASLYASHPDHMAVGVAAMAAVYPDSRNPFSFPELLDEGLEPYSVGEVWIMAHASSNRTSDITATFDRKVAALRAHASQHEDPDGLDGRMRGWAASVAKSAGLDEGRLAEQFFALETA